MKRYIFILCIVLSVFPFSLVSAELEGTRALPDSTAEQLRKLYDEAVRKEESGDYKGAFDSYLHLADTRDSLEEVFYVQQIDRLRAENEARQMAEENEQLHLKSDFLYLFISCLLFCCLLLFVMIQVNRRMRKKLAEARDKAERSKQLKSAFLANMSHEIRTPLNAIAGFSQLLADETDPEVCEQYISIIRNNNVLLLDLLNDVVDISRIESDTISFSYLKVYVPDLVDGLCKVYALQVAPSVKLVMEPIPDLHMFTDRNRLTQILSNLLSNAVKHTSEGEIRVGCALSGSEQIRFFVSDTGEGIPHEIQGKIFARFIQAVANKSKGVGLGLALCKGFVEHMGGQIGVESEPGKGSVFWFTLPLRMPDDSEAL